MGFYNRHIMPSLINCLCGMSEITDQRRKLVPQAEGLVVEVGIGSGLNLPHYDAGKVIKVIGIDPDEHMWKAGRDRVRLSAVPVERVGLSGEQIPLDKHMADTVLVTYSLCTIPDAVAALKRLYQRTWFRAEWLMLARESYYQMKILMGKNQNRAVKKQLNPDKNTDYVDRKKW